MLQFARSWAGYVPICAALVFASAFNVRTGLAQEPARPSLARESAAETRRKAESAPGACNVQLGPSKWALAAEMNVEANDNIGFAANHRTFDLILRPQVNARMVCPVSNQNRLNFSLGAGYSEYTLHPSLNRLFVVPGSEVLFDCYMADLWINVHDRLSVTRNAYEDPTLVGSADYSQMQNSAGLTVTWDLNKVIATLGYDHANYVPLSGGQGGLPGGVTDTFSSSLGYHAGPQVTIGVESSGGWIDYDDAATGHSVDWSLGTFVEAQPLEYIKIGAAAGYTVYAPQTVAGIASQEFTGVYSRLHVTHRVNQFVDYNLTGGRSVSFGFFAGTIDMYTASFEARWHLFRKLSMATAFDFEHGSEILLGRETFDRFGPRITLERAITQKLSSSVRYQYYKRRSDIPGGDYELNIVTLNIVYQL